MNYIVSTSIYRPTEATIKYCEKGWPMIMIGDKKTPESCYFDLSKKYSNFLYLSCEYQEKNYKELSDNIGWNSIDRRNIGFVEALRRGAEVIATVDDDNIPYDDWGKNLIVGKSVEVDVYTSNKKISDPLAVHKKKYWHRGFPLSMVKEKNNIEYAGKRNMFVHVQADLWDGDPDIDAISRQLYKPNEKFNKKEPYCFQELVPFNSQNTFLHRSCFPNYMCIPHIGRMDDIYGAYHLQQQGDYNVVFCNSSVFQRRNPHLFNVDFEGEMIGYKNDITVADKSAWTLLNDNAKRCFDIYRKLINEI